MEEEGEIDPAARCEPWIATAPEPLEEHEGLFLQAMVPSCRGRVDVFQPAFLRWLQKRLLPGAPAAAGPAQGALRAGAAPLPSARPGRLLPSP